MLDFDELQFSEFFRRVSGHNPYHYQVAVGQALFSGKNVVLRAPTGAGKTWSVLIPFLYSGWGRRPFRLIYALPLRTLAQGIYREACEAARTVGLSDGSPESAGNANRSPFVTLQTGEQPDDPFFDRGKIIVTTYDQLLSGLLDGPYGLSDRLHNVNAAAVAGALVVFDEFHLMEPQRAFLTAAAGLHLFRGLCQSVWMTATATRALEQVLVEALDAVPIPQNQTEMDSLLEELPSVTQVRRDLVMEPEPLTAESVLKYQEGRSLVLVNTIGRAQTMYESLRERLCGGESGPQLVLLHSRFFRGDRRRKEQVLRSVFGRGNKGPAILVATQVVEAGLDVSCDHLHTELCPMNSLVQRGGRCARFPGEVGTVHVYPLPAEGRPWLPYGDMAAEDPALSNTRELLSQVARGVLSPREAAAWVQVVHGTADNQAVRQGWRARLNECVSRIEQNAIIRNPARVADLIRGEATDSIRVLISNAETRPDTPGQREGLSLSRWSLSRLVQDGRGELGWFWDGTAEMPWSPLRTVDDLRKTYVVCLRPEVAAYDPDVGLRIGIAGNHESPPRIEPKRPGCAPLRGEAWVDHVRRVAEEAVRRLDREKLDDGILGAGIHERYAISPRALREAAAACALLHDLGKLQEGWQRWAEAAQRAKDSNYRHLVPLAHTDFDPASEADRLRERELGVRRPPHAPASGYYAGGFLARLLLSASGEAQLPLASACAAAILAHHGGWLPESSRYEVSGLWKGWELAAASLLGWPPEEIFPAFRMLESHRDKRGQTQKLLSATTSADSLAKWWPLVAYLTRTLRLSDQRATAEGASHE